MTGKFSSKILALQWLFAIFISAGSAVLCSVFIHAYYNHAEEKKIQQAYSDIEDMDLSSLDDKDYAVFLNYENENLVFYIADEHMTPVYSTSDNENAIARNIVQKRDRFSRNPEIVNRKGKYRDSVKIRGILTQNGIDYYVAIKDFTAGGDSITMIEKFYFAILLLMLLPGSILLYFLSKSMLRPMNRFLKTTEQIAGGAFMEQLPEHGTSVELNGLAQNINQMAEQLLRQKEQIEKDRKQFLNQRLLQERNEKQRKELIANISHELKTPLAVISTQAEMLEYVKENQGDYVASIQEEISKMSDMVSLLLDNSVMEHQMENMVLKKLDMKEIITYISMKYEGLAKKKKIHIETFLSEDCYVYGDREYLEQAVNNYMMNALEYTDVGRNIRITLKKQGTFIRVGIYNEGSQIPKEELANIWNSYYRHTAGQTYGRNGFSHAGLGLYIVQNVITAHNGTCGAENIPSGVEFWFTLPGLETSD